MKTKGVDYGQERKLVCQQLLKSIGIDFERELASIFNELTDEPSNHIQPEYGFVPPFMGGNDIKLIVSRNKMRYLLPQISSTNNNNSFHQ